MNIASASDLTDELDILTPQDITGEPEEKEKGRFDDRERFSLLPQPEAIPISQHQLAAEAERIYAGLIIVESKCIYIDSAKACEAPTKLPRKQKRNGWTQSRYCNNAKIGSGTPVVPKGVKAEARERETVLNLEMTERTVL
ncbi:hypothetical protein KC365_g3961 [Hortaea werneckii]|nr:hypothetical protein KC365_g3961 [Hortaea werneckii]